MKQLIFISLLALSSVSYASHITEVLDIDIEEAYEYVPHTGVIVMPTVKPVIVTMDYEVDSSKRFESAGFPASIVEPN